MSENICPQCFNTGTKLEEGKGAVPCECRRPNTTAHLLRAARIPPRFADCSFHNFFPKNDSQFFAHGQCSKLVDEYPDIDRGLLLMGTIGTGKTHLAAAILNTLIEKKGVSCLFHESGSLLKAIQDSYNPVSAASELGLLSPVYQTEVLVLDELGASVPTNWVRDTLYQIINTRYNDLKLTIFTTNYLDVVPEIQMPTLEERIGVRLRSRLFEMCKGVMVEGEDYRRRYDQRSHLKLQPERNAS